MILMKNKLINRVNFKQMILVLNQCHLFILYFVVSQLYENYNQVTETENNALLIKAKIISTFGKTEYNKKSISVDYLDNNDY